ncbi:MAG: HRDC domain-containing protein [Gemmataceae bacterium]|nr:HRDC domain-containing protein [Gemmataceae bacterium]MDW8265622.1 HRDC domain-containing protein [Gemmataceae bacterium]
MPSPSRPNLPEQIVSRPEELAEVCEHLAQCPRFGFDTEFVGEESYHPHLCLIQVATPERLVLIDPMTVGPLDQFWRLVTDPNRQVVVHGGREEVRLCSLWTGHKPGNLFDLQLAAGLVGTTYPIGHATLVLQVTGVQLAKGETLTEWRNRPLTRQQIRYAFDDVRYLLPLADHLTERLQQRNRWPWAEEEFRRLLEQAVPDEPPTCGDGERWRKLRGVGSLDRRRLALVRALYSWREEMAAQLNRPPRAICRDDILVEIARRNPMRPRDLQVVRGLPRRIHDAVLEVLERTRALPLEQCPPLVEREHEPPQMPILVGVLTAYLADWCQRQELAQSLVASSADLRGLVRAHVRRTPLPPGNLLAQGWRQRHVLPELEAILTGRRSLRIADVSSETPFAWEAAEGS